MFDIVIVVLLVLVVTVCKDSIDPFDFANREVQTINTHFSTTPFQIQNGSIYDNDLYYLTWSPVHWSNITYITYDSDLITAEITSPIPWNGFLSDTIDDTQIPGGWFDRLDIWVYQLTQLYDATRIPVYLKFQLLDAGKERNCPETNRTNASPYPSSQDFEPCDSCYDFGLNSNESMFYKVNQTRNAYLRYITYITQYFLNYDVNITHLTYASEINFYIQNENCPYYKYYNLVDYLNVIYDELKANDNFDDINIFPTIGVDSFIDFDTYTDCASYDAINTTFTRQCIEENMKIVTKNNSLKFDSIAIEGYSIYSNYNYYSYTFDYVLNNYNQDIPIVFAGSAKNTNPLKINFGTLSDPDCFVLLNGSINIAIDWIDYVTLNLTQRYNISLILWWENTNMMPQSFYNHCPSDCNVSQSFESENVYFCQLFQFFRDAGLQEYQIDLWKLLGDMGLRYYNGTPKTDVYDAWQKNRLIVNDYKWINDSDAIDVSTTDEEHQSTRTTTTPGGNTSAAKSTILSIVRFYTLCQLIYVLLNCI